MAFEKKVPQWNAAGAEPPESLKNSGFQPEYKPPADYFNWFWYSVSQCLTELQGMSLEDIGAASAADHIYKSFRFAAELGVEDSVATMDKLVAAMDNGTILGMAVTTAHAALDTPTKYGNLLIVRGDPSRVFAVFVEINSGKMWVGSVNSNTGDFGGWHSVYSDNNKPTPADIGAVDKTGDIMSGNLFFSDVNGAAARITAANGAALVWQEDVDNNASDRNLIKLLGTNQPLASLLQLATYRDGVEAWYKIYGEHNKPTPTEIGAQQKHEYYFPSDIGCTYASTLTEMWQALPAHAAITINCSTLTDASWNFPNAYSTMRMEKHMDYSRGRILLFAKGYGEGDYRMYLLNEGVPSGVWYKNYDEANKPTPADIGAAVNVDHSVTVETSHWSQSTYGWYQTQWYGHTEIKSSDKPVVDVVFFDDDFDTNKLIISEWAKVFRVTTTTGCFRFFATELPSVRFKVNVKVVR